MPPTHHKEKPLVGITLDAEQLPARVRLGASWNYAACVVRAGGVPLMLPPVLDQIDEHLRLCDAFILTGGDDPVTEPFGEATHEKATRVIALRQDYETNLLRTLADAHPQTPVLGVCLGMQMMALVAGGRLHQHLPETHPHADRHWDATHPVHLCCGVARPEGLWCGINRAQPEAPDAVAEERGGDRGGCEGEWGGDGGKWGGDGGKWGGDGGEWGGDGGEWGGKWGGTKMHVHSRHRQAVQDAGPLVVLARADDGLIEAITDPARAFYVGVQWHPERTTSPLLGEALFTTLLAHCPPISPPISPPHFPQ